MAMARSGGSRITRPEGPASPAGRRRGGLQDSPAVRDHARLARTPPSPHALKLLVAPVIFLVICSNVANVLWPTLHEEHPLLLIALSSINRYLILVSGDLDAVSYYVVGTARLLVSDPLFFLLGYWYGDRALEWMDRKAPTYGPMLRRFQDVFGKAAWPLVAIMPNNFICLFAGAAGMRIGVFFALNLTGTLARLYLIRRLGETFASPIDRFQDVVAEYRWWFIAGSALLVLFSLRKETGTGGELDTLVHVDEELAEPSAAEHIRHQLDELEVLPDRPTEEDER
jgi:membrane protein DedA with SNARE-associated domain